jgi:PAS domain S-box-containing protein
VDISERKAAEEALRRQALMFDAVSDAIIVTDLAARIADWNPAAERLFGYAREDVLGRKTALLHRPEDAAALAARVLAGVTEQGRWEGEITFVRADGTEGVCHTVTLPLRDERGVRLGNIGVNRDITARKAAEATLGRYQERLLALHEAAVLLAAQTDPGGGHRDDPAERGGAAGREQRHLLPLGRRRGLLRCAHNWQVPANDTTPDQRPGEGLAGHAFLLGETLLVNDYPGWAHAMPSGRAAGLRAALAAPLVRAGRPSASS